MNGSFGLACVTAQEYQNYTKTTRDSPTMTQRESAAIPRFLTSPLLEKAGFRHAFFTRVGGVSEGPYASLSFSAAAGDSQKNVDANLERAAAALGVDASRLYFASQVHGCAGVWVMGNEDRKDVLRVEADAVAGENPRAAVCVRIADCVPILVGDRERGAAVAIHAGWKGLVAGVVEQGIAVLRRAGSAPKDLVCAIGPHITLPAFEVSDDVAQALRAASSDKDVVELSYGPKPHVDLARITRAQLIAAGVPGEAVDLVPGCTLREPDRFFSFRRDGAKSGRHLAAIVPLATSIRV
jgi:YfiH family protein